MNETNLATLQLATSALQTTQFAAQADLLQMAAAQTAPETSLEAASTFSEAPSTTALAMPDRGRFQLPAAIAAGLTVLAPSVALAQTPGVENLASVLPHLPPSWQLIAGGLLYAEPAARMTSRFLRRIVSWFSKPAPVSPPPAQPQTVLGKINQATGFIERRVGPVRDAAALGVGLYAGAQVLFSGSPVMDHLPEAIAFGLSYLSYNDRTSRVEADLIRTQVANHQILHPAGQRAQESRALGILAPDVPKQFPEEHIAGETPPQYAQGAKPGFSIIRNLRGLGTTISMLVGIMRRSHVYTEGFRNTFMGWVRSARPEQHAPVSEKYLATVDVTLPQWAMRVAEHYGVSLSFSEMDRLKLIPKGAPVVFAAFPHSAIYTDFMFWQQLPRARFVADKRNFHDHPIVRAIGLAWFLDVIGLPFVSRSRKRSDGTSYGPSEPPVPGAVQPANGKNLYDQTTDRMQKYGIMPVFFGQAGRAPRAYRDDRNLSRPGLYSNVVNPKDPTQYYNLRGTVRTALAAAKKMGQTAYIPILFIKGSGRAMPKVAKNPPFIQPVQPGDVGFTVGEIISVSAGADPIQIERQIIAAAKNVMKINDKLEKEFRRWADQVELPRAGENFRRLADADERLYIIADRIRSVHPNHPMREVFKGELAEIITTASRGRDVNESIASLLADVSKVVKETEYQ